jgi:hypothetical protein
MVQPTDRPDFNNGPSEALTSIHHTYTLAATNDIEGSEVERLMVKHFIETLAEISLAIASRKINEQEQSQ